MFGVAPPGIVPSPGLAVALSALGEGVEPMVVVVADEVVVGGAKSETLGALTLT